MRVLELNISGYRNLSKVSINPSPGVNFIYGKNAQGKTNLIEAVWMFTGARSFRGTKDIDLVDFSKDSAKLEGKFFLEKREQNISVFFGNGKRKAFLNGVAQPYPTKIIGKFRVILFSPIHLSLVGGGPESRRKFLDAAICQLKPTYISHVSKYNQILKQRNALLKNFSMDSDGIFLEVLDEKLAQTGSVIIFERLKYLDCLKKEALRIYSEISGNSETMEMNYIPSFSKNISSQSSVECIKNEIFMKLKKSSNSDIKSGHTSFGPHKDELEIFIDGKKVRLFGSQGQRRSTALCLKLAEACVLREFCEEAPVILLDDVMSELDDFRKNYLISKINENQVFITDCDSDMSRKFKKGKLFEVNVGKVQEVREF